MGKDDMDKNSTARLRIALLADIHGNRIALDAVLADIEKRGGADAYWVVGDLVALGPQPVAVLERLQELEPLVVVRGNTDRYVTTDDRPGPFLSQVQADPTLLPTYAEVAATFAWTQGAVAVAGWRSFLDELPLEYECSLPDGTKVLVVHASPGADNEPSVSPDLPTEALRQLFKGCTADLVVVGHTHWPTDRRAGHIRVINPGSIGNPIVPDLRAGYALLEAAAGGYSVHYYRVAYDRDAVIRHLEEVRHPGRAYISRFLKGGFVREERGMPDVYAGN
jgi:putative phosphoesterase